ncbi:hypothetical protein [Kribbella sp. NPDC049227]|uniref:hypothetical protein n=1 Tax=Kribbella sp. NPDC049227 TaxID=3364113 RepID=UPI00371F96B0
MRKWVLALTSAITLLAGSTLSAVPANATDTSFQACVQDSCEGTWTAGSITWLNRTATLSSVTIFKPEGVDYSATVIFDAFAGTTKIDTQTRTMRTSADRQDFPAFTIGDPNLVGGINRIRVQLCENDTTPPFCGIQQNFWR